MGWEVDAMNSCLVLFLALSTPATVRSGSPFCSSFSSVFCLYQVSNLLATIGELLRLERRPLNQIIVP